jgi:hypothetical protein
MLFDELRILTQKVVANQPAVAAAVCVCVLQLQHELQPSHAVGRAAQWLAGCAVVAWWDRSRQQQLWLPTPCLTCGLTCRCCLQTYSIAAARDADGRPSCIRDECAHRACPLSVGRVVDGKVRRRGAAAAAACVQRQAATLFMFD